MFDKLYQKLSELKKATQEQNFAFGHSEVIAFSDFVDNHVLPVVWGKENGRIIYSNKAMNNMVGFQVCGKQASIYYSNYEEYTRVSNEIKGNSNLKGLPVMLKNCDEQTIRCKLYTNVHRCGSGNWLNTRCIFVPQVSDILSDVAHNYQPFLEIRGT